MSAAGYTVLVLDDDRLLTRRHLRRCNTGYNTKASEPVPPVDVSVAPRRVPASMGTCRIAVTLLLGETTADGEWCHPTLVFLGVSSPRLVD